MRTPEGVFGRLRIVSTVPALSKTPSGWRVLWIGLPPQGPASTPTPSFEGAKSILLASHLTIALWHFEPNPPADGRRAQSDDPRNADQVHVALAVESLTLIAVLIMSRSDMPCTVTRTQLL